MANGRTGRTAANNSLFSSSEEIAERKRKERASFGSKVDEVNAKRKAEREAKAAKRKEQMEESTARLSESKKATSLKAQESRNPRGRSSSKPKDKAAAKPAAKADSKSTTKTWKDVKSVAAAKAAGLKNYTGRDGKKKAAIDASEIKKGESMTQAFNRIQGKTARKPSSKTTKSTTNTTTTKTPKKVGGIRRFLLGPDGEFGGARGAIDFFPGKSRPKKEDKPVKKMGGGMMKSKMSSKGGARGGRNPMGMKNGGFPDLNKDGKVTQADILQGRGVVKKKAGGMAKKGYAKGGMTKKGYANGGAVRSKMASKGGASRKPRGVGVAMRGYGKAMR